MNEVNVKIEEINKFISFANFAGARRRETERKKRENEFNIVRVQSTLCRPHRLDYLRLPAG